jgi:hypothetical protein
MLSRWTAIRFACCTKDTLLDSLVRGQFCGTMCQFHTPNGGMTAWTVQYGI